MTDWLWAVLLLQMAMGAFDTLYHHEGTERLAWRPSQAGELGLHGVRNLAYAIMFTTLGWVEPHGGWALAFCALLAGELFITLWDFVEEDRSRALPPSERITHTLLTLNYGCVLALLAPVIAQWAAEPTALIRADHGVLGWLCAVASVGVIVSGLRDLAAARRAPRLVPGNPARLATALPAASHILVTGATGFIGERLVAGLVAAGHDVTILTRNAASARDLPAPLRIVTRLDQISASTRLDAIVNLAGEPIASAPWTAARRRRIVRSRLRVTRDVVALIARLETPPAVLVSGSAIGWYGLHGDAPLDEAGDGNACFSRRLCMAWEATARRAERYGVRTVLLRTGLVLDSSGGLLSRLLVPFEFAVGGRIGTGMQWMSWIHRDDLCRMIVHAIATPALRGPLNATAPHPVTNSGFTAALAQALHRPAIIPIPAAPLRWALGDFADELLLGGARVVPRAALASGFTFVYPDIAAGFAAITGAPATTARHLTSQCDAISSSHITV